MRRNTSLFDHFVGAREGVLPYHAAGCLVDHGKFWPAMPALGH
jgi:hypothetical protein